MSKVSETFAVILGESCSGSTSFLLVVEANFKAVDVHFEPDLQAAEKHFDGLTATSIAGEAFTIRDVPVR